MLPPILLDTVSPDLLLTCDPEGGNDLLTLCSRLLVLVDARYWWGGATVQLAQHLLRQQEVDAEWLLKGMSLYLASRLHPAIA